MAPVWWVVDQNQAPYPFRKHGHEIQDDQLRTYESLHWYLEEAVERINTRLDEIEGGILDGFTRAIEQISSNNHVGKDTRRYLQQLIEVYFPQLLAALSAGHDSPLPAPPPLPSDGD